MARDGEIIQKQDLCHHEDTIFHPNLSYVTTKLYGSSVCGRNNNSACREWRHALSWICTTLTSGRLSDKLFSEMASGHVNALKFLSEEDVPGASFIYAKLEKHSVDQLRRWLACRGINRSGNKTAWNDQYFCVRTADTVTVSVPVAMSNFQ